MGAGRQLAAEQSLRSRMWQAARIPPLGGLLGGTFVGLVESIYVAFNSSGTRDWSGVLYAVLLYGAVGLAGGLGLAVGAALLTLVRGKAPEPARSWTLSFLAVALPLGLIIGRFLLRRDVFAETPPTAVAQATLLVGLGVFAGVFYVLVRNALAKTFFSFLTLARGSWTVYALTFLFWLALGVANCVDNEAGADLTPSPVPPVLEHQPNVLLVVVDTLRADALGVYGGPTGATPRTDRWAAGAHVYEQAIAPAPWTRPSFASFLTSTVPCTHQTFRKADRLPDELDTVAEQLQTYGYTTGAIVNNINVAASFNFGQGFDTFEFMRPTYPFRSEASFRLTLFQMLRLVRERYLPGDKRVERFYHDGEAITDATIDWLSRHGRSRWFLMTHYMDPHDPYFPHPYDGSGYARVEHPHPGLGEASWLAELYAGEVSYWDTEFGRLLDWMEERELLEDTVVILTSDHGEEFGEHGGFWHGNRLYDEAIRVPLIMRVPGHSASRVRDQVRLIDLPPTIADLAGAPHGRQWQGFSLLRGYALRDTKDRLALAEGEFEGFQLRAVRDQDWKLIENLAGPSDRPRPPQELFYLAEDPGELRDLSGDAAAAWALQARHGDLEALQLAGCGQAAQQDVREEVGEADCERLRSLGYTDLAEGLCGKR